MVNKDLEINVHFLFLLWMCEFDFRAELCQTACRIVAFVIVELHMQNVEIIWELIGTVRSSLLVQWGQAYWYSEVKLIGTVRSSLLVQWGQAYWYSEVKLIGTVRSKQISYIAWTTTRTHRGDGMIWQHHYETKYWGLWL